MTKSSRVRTGKKVAARESRRTVVAQLEAIQNAGGDGEIDFGGGKSLHVSSLDKVYFPDDGITKGDVMRYYALVAPVLLPVIKDRPLILKRFPGGIAGPSFFQQNAGPHVAAGVRTGAVGTAGGARADRIIGGDLPTVLYTVQIGTIAVHAWQARFGSPDVADSTTIDLDPGENVKFGEVVALARNIRAELDRLELWGALKTSGSSGLHIALPLPPNTTFDEAARLAEIVTQRVVDKYPARATLERSISARPEGTIYVDAQQNAKGKSVVAAYSVRERPRATVSAPLAWTELRSGLRMESFTVMTMPGRLKKVGDLWGKAMKRRNTRRSVDRVLRNA